jgi:hypothetical protein
MDRMVLYPVNRFILKIVFKMRARACGVLRACGVFLCGFASKKIPREGSHTSPLVPPHLYTTLCPAPGGERQRSSLRTPVFLQTTLILQFSWHFLQFS